MLIFQEKHGIIFPSLYEGSRQKNNILSKFQMNNSQTQKRSSLFSISIIIILFTILLASIIIFFIPRENINEEIRGTTKIITSDDVQLLQEPKIGSTPLTVIPKNSEVFLTGRTYSFITEFIIFEPHYEIVFNGFIGWIKESELAN